MAASGNNGTGPNGPPTARPASGARGAAGGVAAASGPGGADVVIRGVGKAFRRRGRRTVALSGVDQDAGAGEFVCLLGPSGCGKSTLLRIVAGALDCDEGTVTVGGKAVGGPAPERGVLFQSPMLFPWLTTRRNVPFGPKAQRSRGRLDTAAHRAAVRRARARRVGIGAAGLILALLLWQAASALLRDTVILPSVTQTARAFGQYLTRPYPTQSKPLGEDLLISPRQILIGPVIGTAGGIAVGSAMPASRFTRQVIDPVIEVIRPLPPLAFIPLFIVWFGIGELPEEVLIVFGVIPVMTVATVAALGEVPEDLRLCAWTLGASRAYMLIHVQIPAALPGIVTAMRFAMAGAWTSIVAAEMLAATSGVGYLISQASNFLNTSLVLAGIITITVAGLALDACLRGLLLLVDPTRRA